MTDRISVADSPFLAFSCLMFISLYLIVCSTKKVLKNSFAYAHLIRLEHVNLLRHPCDTDTEVGWSVRNPDVEVRHSLVILSSKSVIIHHTLVFYFVVDVTGDQTSITVLKV